MGDSHTTAGRAFALWMRLGEWVGRHLVTIVPIGVAVGIAFPQLLLPIKPFIPTIFALMTLQSSLTNDPSAMRNALRRPVALAVTILWVHVVAPLLAWGAACLAFGPDSPTVAGVVLEYAVPMGTSTIMWIGMFEGEMALGLSALLASTMISPFTIPATLKLLVGATIEFNPLGMMGSMCYMVALPALIATVANVLTKGRSAKLAKPTSPFSRLLLPLIVATNATGLADYARHPTMTLLAIALFMLVLAILSFLVGMALAYRLAGRDRKRFVATAFCCGIRNVSAGAVLASQYFGPEVMFPAIIGTPFQQVLAATFGRIMERRLEEMGKGRVGEG